MLLFTMVLACRSFCCFRASWCPLAASWCRLGPLSLPFGSHFGPQNGSQNGFRNGPFLKPPRNHPHPPGISFVLCRFFGVGGSFGRSTAAETPLFDIPSLLLFVPHFVLGHLSGPQLLSLKCGRGWGVPSVGPAGLLPLLLNSLASFHSVNSTSFSATFQTTLTFTTSPAFSPARPGPDP